jgi:plastocyanin
MKNHRPKEGSPVLRRLLLPLAAVVVVASISAFVLLPESSAAQTELQATVGPGFSISLRDSSGVRVTHLDPGTYTINVNDLSTEHNFHLQGTGVDQATPVEETGNFTWTVTFTDAVYRFQCDAHPTTMRGSFTVGSAQPPPPPPPPPPSGVAKGTKFKGTVGPSFTISLKDAKGKRVKKVKAGTRYTIVVRDKSSRHNFHLSGPGVNKKTSVAKKGTATWKLKFKKGKTYRYRCDPHRAIMKGSFKAV